MTDQHSEAKNSIVEFIRLITQYAMHLCRSATRWIFSNLVLMIVFFAIFMPLGFMLRAIGYDPLHRRIDITRHSYYQRSKQRKRDHMDKPY